VSSDTDRVAVPTNGKGPHPIEPAEPDFEEVDPTTVVFTPTQLAVGFGILASLVVLLVREMRRRGRTGGRGPFGRR
jgi:hypothetical protein